MKHIARLLHQTAGVRGLLAVAVGVSTIGVGAATSYAASPLFIFCDNGGSGLCLRVASNNPAPNSQVYANVSRPLTVREEFHLVRIGTVTASASKNWPFTPGRQLNGKFIGDPVFQIEYAPAGRDSSNCLSVPDRVHGVLNTSVVTNTCSSLRRTSWVQAYNGQYWINVRATNHARDKHILVLKATSNQPGQKVVVAPYQQGNKWEEFVPGRV